MDSAFRSAKEKLEKEHRERKERGKLKLEREKKAKDAAQRQRQAIEASQRVRRIDAIEAQCKRSPPNRNVRAEKQKRSKLNLHDIECGATASPDDQLRIDPQVEVNNLGEGEKYVRYNKGGSLTKRNKRSKGGDSSLRVLSPCMMTPPWWVKQGLPLRMRGMNLTEEQRGEMRQEANVVGGSQGLSDDKKSGDYKDLKYLKANYAAQLKRHKVAEKPNQQESVGSCCSKLQKMDLNLEAEAEEEEEKIVDCEEGG